MQTLPDHRKQGNIPQLIHQSYYNFETKPGKNSTRKENYRPRLLMYTDGKLLNKF